MVSTPLPDAPPPAAQSAAALPQSARVDGLEIERVLRISATGVVYRPVARASSSPREECGARTEFALYRCMRLACASPSWEAHAQCTRLRATDEVD
jgi:hypothetical protein